MNKINKLGFTLAEVLITLGIIGIVSVMIIPFITTTYQKIVYPIQLKKIYNNLLTVQAAINDEFGNPEYWRFTSYQTDSDDRYNIEIFKRYVTQLNAVSYKNKGDYNYFKHGLSDSVVMLNRQPAVNVPEWATGSYIYESWKCYSMQLKNGATIAMYFANSKAGGVLWSLIGKQMYAAFLIDVNGLSGPNMVGRDIFAFGLKRGNGSIVPYMDDTSDCNEQGAGLSCSRKIIQDGWKMNY